MRMPAITYRVDGISPPFDADKRVEITLDVIIKLGDTQIVSRISRCIPVEESSELVVGETWDAHFIQRIIPRPPEEARP